MIDTNPSAVISIFMDNHLVGKCAIERSDQSVFPRETACLSALAAASHAVGSVYTVCYPDGGYLPIPLYAIAEQPSGTGKSRLVNDFYSGYVDQASKLNKEMAQKKQKLKRSTNDKLKRGDHHGLDEELEMLAEMMEIPKGTTDATPQSLEKVMARHGGFFMVYGTEQNLTKTLLGGFYAEGKTVDGIINSAFNGEHSSTERASDTRVTFHGRPFGGIFCLSQEGTIQTVLDSAGGSGLAERFLMIREDDLLGYGDKYESLSHNDLIDIVTGRKKPTREMVNQVKTVLPTPAFDQYKSKMTSLANMRHKLKDCELADLKRLKFAPESWAIIEAAKSIFKRKVAEQETRNAFIASMNSKIDIMVMKVSATLHVFDCADYQDVGLIPAQTVIDAFSIVSMLFEGVSKISSENNLFGDKAEDDFVFDYIQSQRKPVTSDKICQSLTRRENSPFKFYQVRGESRKKVREAIDRLVACGRVFETKGETPVYIVR
jgi:hypothetical protein